MPSSEPSYANGPYTSQRFSLPSTSSIRDNETDTKGRIKPIFKKGVAAEMKLYGIVPDMGPIATQASVDSRVAEVEMTLRSIIDSTYNPLAERTAKLEEQQPELVNMTARQVIDAFESGVAESG